MSTHMPGFQSFFRFFLSFCIALIRHQQHKGYYLLFCLTSLSHLSRSPEWEKIGQDQKEKIGLTFDDDGEF